MKKIWLFIVLLLVGCAQVEREELVEDDKPLFIVVHKGTVLLEIDPEIDETYYFEGSNGPMAAEVKDGLIRMIESDCPDKLCIEQEWMAIDDIMPIICLPNEVMISSSTAMFN